MFMRELERIGALFNIGTDEFRPVVKEGSSAPAFYLARNAREEKIVELQQARQIGMRVRVKRTYNSVPELQGQVGTINQRYGGVHHPAFKVCFEDGRSQLFWSHQLEEA
jgi:hypothetical protein